jgi:hypothetical protein
LCLKSNSELEQKNLQMLNLMMIDDVTLTTDTIEGAKILEDWFETAAVST